MILKFIHRYFFQTRVLYFSGWKESNNKQLSEIPGHGVNYPFTSYLGAAKILSKTEAEIEKIKWSKWMEENYGHGTVKIIKNARAKRAGWRG
jgi:hypothetical protein